MLGGWVGWTLGYVGATKLARNDANLVRRLLWPPVRHRRHRTQGRLVHIYKIRLDLYKTNSE